MCIERIYQNYLNLKPIFWDRVPKVTEKKIIQFLKDHISWTKQMIEKSAGHDPFWRQVSYVMAQLDGLVEGYNVKAAYDHKIDYIRMFTLSASGDMMSIAMAVSPELYPDFTNMTRDEVERYVFSRSRCSALVKVTDDYSDLLMGHSTWFMYQSMMRIYKYYTIHLSDKASVIGRMSFSSYPGFLVSIDDFYVMADTSMVMIQTTNSIFNKTMYSAIHPQSLLAWQRVRVANMMSNSGSQWADALATHHSGTYPNQYMVVDLKLFKPNVELEDNLLWVVEEIPDLVMAADQTQILRNGYWSSYNVPFYEKIYNLSGYPDIVKMKGLDFSYQMAPRAKIFRRDHGKVNSVKTIQEILRSNDYKNDPFSEGNPCKAICCRGELRKEAPFLGGCIDTKVTSFKMAEDCAASIISGPTTASNIPPFHWGKKYANVSHIGLPEEFNFDFFNVFATI
ncbi:phospholipase B-like 1 isoform X2 [Gigantopelta aegis]|uniref:phospholipase B-like 1 isoform X2 n=1 Tax=Gigantopelta aegis TaxID=1735272 RepID=UPI001B88A371|nr:phospholipase B-like 1 isoform X2 [Gigantopelta aegis]